MFPEDEFIHDDMDRDEYLKMIGDGVVLDEIPRLLCDPINKQECTDEAINNLVTEEESMNIVL